MTGDGPHEAKAAKATLAEHSRRVGARKHAMTDAAVVRGARSAIDGLLAVVRFPSGSYQGFTQTDPVRGPWLTIHDLDRTGAVTATEDWKVLAPRLLPRMDVLWSDQAWASYPVRPDLSKHVTTPEIEELEAAAKTALVEAGGTPIVSVLKWRPYSGDINDAVIAFGWKPGLDLADATGKVDEHLIAYAAYWKRDKGRFTFFIAKVRYPRWSVYSDGPRDRPWRTADSRWWKAGESAEMVWSDEAQIALVDVYEDIQAERSKQAHSADDKIRSAVARHRDALQEAFLARETAKERARFKVDFGTDADEAVWEHHLGTLRIDRRYREPVWAYDLFYALARNGIDPSGKSFEELVTVYTGELTTGKKIDAGDYADLVL